MKTIYKTVLKSIILISIFSIFITTATSCDEDEVDDITSDNPNSDAIIYANFANNGTNQILTLDVNKTNGPIQIENDVLFTTEGTRYNFEFSGVTFIEGEAVYEVNNIISQIFNEGEWQQDSENFLNPERSKSLDIVLVLDVSSSLGDNLDGIKQSARLILDQIFVTNNNAKVAIVKFSRGNIATILSSNNFELGQFILQTTNYTDTVLGGGTYTLENKNETALYEAMLKGIEILENSNARGQGLITFTDGTNNFQFNSMNSNREIVINELNQSNIKSYTIGFVGNADEVNDAALIELAVNGSFNKPTSITELDQVFTLFSNSIGAVYDLVYDTNNAPFEGTKSYRFLIDLNKIN